MPSQHSLMNQKSALRSHIRKFSASYDLRSPPMCLAQAVDNPQTLAVRGNQLCSEDSRSDHVRFASPSIQLLSQR